MSGKVSANAEILMRVCRAITADEQAAVKKIAAEFFEVRNGYLFNEKVEHELARSRAIAEKRRDAGKRGAAKTNGNKSANAAANAGASDAANMPASNRQTTQQPIPTYSVSKDTGAAAPFSPSVTDTANPKKRLFDIGVSILTQAGDNDKNARSFLAKFAKQDEAKLGEVLGHLAAHPKIEPKSYIVAAFKPEVRTLSI